MQNISTEQGERRQGEGHAITESSFEGQQRSAACPTLIESFLPVADIVVNEQIVVMATPEATYAALKRVDFARSHSLLLRAALALRVAEARRARRRLRLAPLPAPARVSLQNVEDYGQIKLAEQEGSEIVVGAIARLMNAESLYVRRSAAEFKAFDCPGYVKVAASYAVTPHGQRRTMLSYEVRIRATDTRTRRQLFFWDALTSPLMTAITRRALRYAAKVVERQCAAQAHRQAM
ncbi:MULTISPECIES: hypothetical protein [Sorangium]|uniref:Uncharacterized protein n=1 Tax=Sorangium cellulosum TaxID=56 RepID=A0A4P2QR67_SORCE|nr:MULTISPECIES: hypothetical protein [Sorangium]AUX32518.1 hypothetical protein SOCE836_046580 [Sorangium cellulosum]WCQ91891.1 hypothetical protein NQZ70_04618 [Sorangium sp. Soce836]